jgi:hypothetical protein
MHHEIPSKDFIYFNRSKFKKILATNLRRKNENKKREREEWERFGYSNNMLRINVSNEGGEDFFYTWEPRVIPLGCSPSVIC